LGSALGASGEQRGPEFVDSASPQSDAPFANTVADRQIRTRDKIEFVPKTFAFHVNDLATRRQLTDSEANDVCRKASLA